MLHTTRNRYEISDKDVTYNVADKLGRGHFGTVYKAKWLTNIVAIKLLNFDIPRDSEEDFQKEIDLMLNLRSPQIVSVFGAVLNPFQAIVMEFMSGGDLYSLLHKNKDRSLELSLKYQIGLDIALGIKYLHDLNILHCDLKSLNVLLNENDRAKLSDFGLAKTKKSTNSHSSSKGKGTTLWMAPELFTEEGCSTKESDIYSFGMILYELLTREIPFDSMLKDRSPYVLPGLLLQGKRPNIPVNAPSEFTNIIKSCWNQTKELRPTADTVIQLLQSIQSTTNSHFSAQQQPVTTSGPRYLSFLHSKGQPEVPRQYPLHQSGQLRPAANLAADGYTFGRRNSVVTTSSVPEAAAPILEAIPAYPQEPPQQMLYQYQAPAGYPIAPQFPMVNPQEPAQQMLYQHQAPAGYPIAPQFPMVNPQELSQFLYYVGYGFQNEAEQMLRANPNLAQANGNLTDCAGRQFTGITGFQYALWALDWYMWSMIKNYMPREAVSRQVQELDSGPWVAFHGRLVDWQRLINALQQLIDNWEPWSAEQIRSHWCRQVGGAQLLLPAHVINEYMREDLPFYNPRSFTENASLPRLGVNVWRSPPEQLVKSEWTLDRTPGSLGANRAGGGGVPGCGVADLVR